MKPAISRPPNSARGKSRRGFCVSSATLTESSKPISAKNARPVPPMIASGTASPSLKVNARPASPPPSKRKAAPMITTSTSPASSMIVRTTLIFTLSAMPRKLIAAITARKHSETRTTGRSTNSER